MLDDKRTTLAGLPNEQFELVGSSKQDPNATVCLRKELAASWVVVVALPPAKNTVVRVIITSVFQKERRRLAVCDAKSLQLLCNGAQGLLHSLELLVTVLKLRFSNLDGLQWDWLHVDPKLWRPGNREGFQSKHELQSK